MIVVEIEVFCKMILQKSHALAFNINEICCIDSQEITPMATFTVPHFPWNLKPIPIPKALLSKLIDLLKEKLGAKILELVLCLLL